MIRLAAVVLALATMAPASHAQQSSVTVNFMLDCMIHDAHGAMLKDLGTLGLLSDGTFVSYAKFPYNDMQVEASIQGPTTTTPEVNSAVQLAMRFVKSTDGNQITAAVVTDLDANRDIALFEPTLNVFLHCTKMAM